MRVTVRQALSSFLPLALATFCLPAVLAAGPGSDAGASVKTPPAAAPAAQTEKASPQQEFETLLAKVKKYDKSVDFAKLRQLQTQLDSYDPYGADVEEHPFHALDAGDVQAAKGLAAARISANYLDLEGHLAAAAVFERLGDKAAAAHHRYVFQGVVDSILASGDGRSPATAYSVVAISEEYALMQSRGLEVAGQDLIHSEGHSYDMLTGVDPKTKTEQRVFFNIDPIMGALDKQLAGN